MDPVFLHRKSMKRRDSIAGSRFLTFSCNHRLQLFNNDAIKRAFVISLAKARIRSCFKLFAWVIMPEHVHLLLAPAPGPRRLAPVLQALKSSFARIVIARWRKLDAPILDRISTDAGRPVFWLPGGGYDRNILTEEEFIEKFNYIHQNPVTRGLVSHAAEWKWSSAQARLGDPNAVTEIDPIDLPECAPLVFGCH